MEFDKRSFENNVNASEGKGPFLARVIENFDPKYMGTLRVQLLRDVGNRPNDEGSFKYAKYMSPFYGVTGVEHNGQNNDFTDTQKAYGMWMVPPDPGTIVIVMKIEGFGWYWMGCVQDEFMNFMVPGLAATEVTTEKGSVKKPAAEYNINVYPGDKGDKTMIPKPVHPFADTLEAQGLLADETRGITTSSARRESPSNVFGISTPGPIDRTSTGKRGDTGSRQNRVLGAFVSRLGGSTFVMDDGDENFLRKKPASEAPPEYASVENDEKGNVKIPHNELIRLRTRTGHQILLHNSEDLIYIGNARGTSWIELTSNGKIDIYAEDSISVHTKNDINFTADRDINFKAGRNVNTDAGGWIKETSVGNNETKATANILETATNVHMNSGGNPATAAAKPQRTPQAEPWDGHENLNPTEHTPDKTEAQVSPVATKGVLTKILDTFKKIGK
jgi:hypothetical protein